MAHETETWNDSRTLNSFPKVVSTSFTADNILVDFAGRDVVVSLQSHVKESFVVTEVEIHFTAIIQYKYLSYKEK